MSSMQWKGTVAVLAVAVGGYALFRRFAGRRRSPAVKSSNAVVTQLIFYPIKSCRGISVNEADVWRYGFENDRRWMVIDEDGRFVTARQIPKMAILVPSFEGNELVVSAEGEESLRIPLNLEGSEVDATVWNFTGPAVDQGDAAAAWFSKVLGRSGLRLVKMKEDHERVVSPKYAKVGNRGDMGYVTGFSDGFPFLLASEESLAELNSKLDSALPMTRFRPNIVVRGAEFPFAEDTWKSMQIGSVAFRGVKKCSRCKMTTVDPARGEFDGTEPLATLRTFRVDPVIDPKMSAVFFGMNLIHEQTAGRLRVGDVVQVFE